VRIAVVGAGILGRLIALGLSARGHRVSVFDERDETGGGSASFVAGGMLAPYCELESAERSIFELGRRSLELWPFLKSEYDLEFFMQARGSLVVAHALDQEELARFRRQLIQRAPENGWRNVGAAEITELEPSLAGRFHHGLYFPNEGQIDTRAALKALGLALRRQGCELAFGNTVARVEPFAVDAKSFDEVVDCRGIGARRELADLRAVRGEIVWVEARDTRPLVTRPVRLMHPRYPLYIIPRPGKLYGIGATALESDDESPVSVRSALELLSAAYALEPAFAEARIVRLDVGLRPAFPANAPRFIREKGLLRINGLYRHGYLIGPALAEQACARIDDRKEISHELAHQW